MRQPDRATDKSAGGLPPELLLIADGDRDAATGLGGRFAARGVPTRVVSAGSEALELMATHHIPLAVIDVALDDMPGDELAYQMKWMSPHTGIVITTADYRPEVEVRARRVGILFYACKPLDLRVLGALVAQAFPTLDGAVSG